jgi:DNA invertase Pin-like site-specific DNA recombinase
MNAQHRRGCKFVAYYRVGADREGRISIGLDAQRKAVKDYMNGLGELVGEFTEIESRKRTKRPELVKALAVCRKLRARLVIAKLNRLSRSPAFIATLIDSNLDFIAADNPHVSRPTIHIVASVAWDARKMISERTKAALAAVKASGRQLGTRNPNRAVKRMAKARKAKAEQFAVSVLPLIHAIEALGWTSNAAIAAQLNARNVPTAWGKKWTHVQVGRVRIRDRKASRRQMSSIMRRRKGL